MIHRPESDGCPSRSFSRRVPQALRALSLCSAIFMASRPIAFCQSADAAKSLTTEEKIGKLTAALAQVQTQINAYQGQLQDLQKQLNALQQELATEKAATASTESPAPQNKPPVPNPSIQNTATATLDEIRERQAIDESQIATHEQTKVETESKYPLKVTGLLLFNTFVNTRQVDIPEDPTYALPGSGSTGLSLRQTVLGLDARGPHLFNADSSADVRVDFFASGSPSNYSANGLLRLRTAHAGLNWSHTRAFIALDRSLIAPYSPSSLVAVGEPPLAWSGNLWMWIPQIGVSHQIPFQHSVLKMAGGLVDAPNPPQFGGGGVTSGSTVWQSERSRWPGLNGRLALAKGPDGNGPELGVGGYFSPHMTANHVRYNAWAATADLRLPFGPRFEFLANAYRGQALGGLGGGGYNDYVLEYGSSGRTLYPLDDIGGWSQLKFKPNQRLEFNADYGIDNPFADDIRLSYTSSPTQTYSGLSRNRAAFGNVIYTPSAYLLFSVEYRKLWTNYASGTMSTANVIGLGAGYRF